MAILQLLQKAAFACFIAATAARHAPADWAHHHKHQALALDKRHEQAAAKAHRPPPYPASSSDSAQVLTYITPSPGASPIAVTKQSQLVGSFVPEFTLCELPPIAFYNITWPPTSARATGAPYQNYSISESIPSGNGTCTTVYSPTMTMVCATTLTALADKYTVSQCHEDLTFSTAYGAVIVTPTPYAPVPSPAFPNNTAAAGVMPNSTVAFGTGLVRRAATGNAGSTITPGPSIETLTTYYLAPWQELTAGTAPRDIDLKVCRTFAQNDTTECIREYQVWSTSLITKTATSVVSVNISTTIHGRSQLLVENFVANVTELLTTFSMSTTIDLEYQTEFTTTHSATRAMSTSTGPTVYQTVTVEHPSQTSM